MALTVVVHCSDDYRLFECLQSIDHPVEVVCAITPNVDIEARLQLQGIRYAVASRGNHSVTSNAGIALVKTDKFLLMDSDCRFAPGAIAIFEQQLNEYEVVKGSVTFLATSSLVSRWTAMCREFDNTYHEPLYKPGLALRQEVAQAINGWFDPKLKSTEDADLGFRIRKAQLKVSYIDHPCIVHAPVPFIHNVRSNIGYGRGARVRYCYLQQRPTTGLAFREVARVVRFVRTCGLQALPLFLVYRAFYYYGYLSGG